MESSQVALECQTYLFIQSFKKPSKIYQKLYSPHCSQQHFQVFFFLNCRPSPSPKKPNGFGFRHHGRGQDRAKGHQKGKELPQHWCRDLAAEQLLAQLGPAAQQPAAEPQPLASFGHQKKRCRWLMIIIIIITYYYCMFQNDCMFAHKNEDTPCMFFVFCSTFDLLFVSGFWFCTDLLLFLLLSFFKRCFNFTRT